VSIRTNSLANRQIVWQIICDNKALTDPCHDNQSGKIFQSGHFQKLVFCLILNAVPADPTLTYMIYNNKLILSQPPTIGQGGVVIKLCFFLTD
jgi:hypothetical protein